MKFIREFLVLLAAFLFVFCTSVAGSYAATINASSASYSDVASAVSSASAGDTVVVPAGTATWTSMLIITQAIKLVGSGIDSTTIINGIINTGAGDFLIAVIPSTPADNPSIEITGFTFDANSEGGCIRINCEDNTYPCTNFRIHHNKMKNTLDTGDSYMSVRVKGNCFGLIDNNQFVDNRYDFKIYGNDQNSWDNYPGLANIGTANYIYIEDNNSTGCDYFIVASGEGARWVYRYNTMDTTTVATLWDAHGDTANDGVVAHEIYENTATSSADPVTGGHKIHDYRGGTGLIYNNSIQIGTSGVRGQIQIREEYEGCNDPVTGGYIWNNVNSRDNKIIATGEDLFGSDFDPFNCIAENTDWWDDAIATPGGESPSNFSYGIATSRPSTCSDDDCYWETDTKKLYRCDGANNWTFIYSPYTYPHPLSKRPGSRTLKITN